MAKNKFGVKWELFQDELNYDMFSVRPVGDKNFNSPRLFCFVEREDADKFKELVEKSYHAVPNK